MGFYATADVQAENRYYPVFRTDESENRLISIESLPAVPDQAKVRLEFTYDYMGRRVSKTVLSGQNGSAYQQTNEVSFVYDGWNLIAALDEDLVAGTTSTNFYLWGLDLSGSLQGAGGVGGLLATTQDGESYFACMDGNGNVMALVDATDGTLAGEYEYGPFGEPLKVDGDAAEKNAVRFSSKYTDAESGLLYYGYRYLDPSTGRWPSRDPIGEDGGQNLYAFVGNEPVAGFDKLGQKKACCGDVQYYPDRQCCCSEGAFRPDSNKVLLKTLRGARCWVEDKVFPADLKWEGSCSFVSASYWFVGAFLYCNLWSDVNHECKTWNVTHHAFFVGIGTPGVGASWFPVTFVGAAGPEGFRSGGTRVYSASFVPGWGGTLSKIEIGDAVTEGLLGESIGFDIGAEFVGSLGEPVILSREYSCQCDRTRK